MLFLFFKQKTAYEMRISDWSSDVCVQVFGNDAAVAFAGSQGNFQLNVYKPVMVHNVLESIQLLSDACQAFNDHCAVGIEPSRERIAENMEKNLMLVTTLNCHIGYDKTEMG